MTGKILARFLCKSCRFMLFYFIANGRTALEGRNRSSNFTSWWKLIMCVRAACPKDSFKEIPGSGPCVECALDRVTSYNGSSSRLDCHCVNGSCSPGNVMVTREITLFNNNFEISSVFYFISHVTTVSGYMWNKTLKLFQNYFEIILFHTLPQLKLLLTL